MHLCASSLTMLALVCHNCVRMGFGKTGGRRSAAATKEKYRRSLLLLLFATTLLIGTVFFLTTFVPMQLFYTKSAPAPTKITPFPVSVNVSEKFIAAHPIFGSFEDDEDIGEGARLFYVSWIEKAAAALAHSSLYQQLAAPRSRILVIESGERREQVVKNFGDILRWNTEARTHFESYVTDSAPSSPDGKFYPGHYLVDSAATPEDVAALVLDRFDAEVASRYSAEVEALVPLPIALTIASLLEREAYSYEDMRHISGVIWNRLFIDMPLQIDATLQYAKGSLPYGPWWPRVVPKDKFIDSPYNTYQERGLPPAPIANPRARAILAALNPYPTTCLFYLHNAEGEFFCSETYDEHRVHIQEQYGNAR
jgi:cell division protein YceG involved in septum cleavage